MDIRHAEQADLPILLDIYNHYVVHTPVTFDIEPRTLAQRQQWFDEFSRTGRHQCFVAVKDGRPVGYACSHRFKEKAAYDPTISTSIYLAPSAIRQGIGRALYATLFVALNAEDVHRAYGGITLPNEASVGLHLAMGFRHIGTETQVGRKFGHFWDVALYERQMP
ncbi:MAG TPA: GNAT family N-acetyltransferase [Rhizomicrobium sp.]|nr:GNAT family N-acetyltransferase [Rhizomicrobium sp.]